MLSESISAVVGRRVDAYFHADWYWRFFVALRAEDGQRIVFSTEERGLAKYFAVFPLPFEFEASEERQWVSFEPLLINTVRPLWRLEWL